MGDPDVLLNAIKLCQLYIKNETKIASLENILPIVDNAMPDTEDFPNASYALNASATVYETLQFLIDKDLNHILNIGTYLTDTVDFKIQENESLTDFQINNHPIMLETRKFLLSSEY
jgi:hypothetical protein